MKRLIVAACALALCAPLAPAAPASNPSDPTQAVKAIESEYNKQMADFSTAYRAAKTNAERQKLFQEKYPKASNFVPRMLKVAEENPKTPAALDALIWVVQNDRERPVGPGGKTVQTPRDQAMKILTDQYADDPKIMQVVRNLGWEVDDASENLCRQVIAKNDDRNAKGMATYILGRILKERIDVIQTMKQDQSVDISQWLGKETADKLAKTDPDALAKEAEALFETVKKDYASVTGGMNKTLGASASAELFEMNNLAIGKTAPEIAGEDVNGKSMKLSDFRGKVVVLDFFGDW